MLLCPLEAYTWVNLKGILQCLPSSCSPSPRAEGAQLPYSTNQSCLKNKHVTELGSSNTWRLETFVSFYGTLEVKTCELGKGAVATINHSVQRLRESQGTDRRMRQEAE